MIKLTVSYPNGEGTTFDHDYYATSHVPLCNEAFAPVKTEVDKGIDGPNAAKDARIGLERSRTGIEPQIIHRH